MKVLIDNWFTENYQTLMEVTSAWIVRMDRKIDPEYLISGAYIYVHNRMSEMTEDDIPKWTYQHIYIELMYPKSTTNKRNNKFNAESVDISELYTLCSEDDLVDFISINHQIESFKTTLDRYDQIIWEVFTVKGFTKKKELAEHFKIDETSAWFLIRDLKDKFKKYAKTEERI